MMLAEIFSLVYNSKNRYCLLLAVLLTISVGALVLFSVALIVYLRKKLLHNLISLSPLIIIVFLAFFLSSDFIISKISGIFVYDNLISGEPKKATSAQNILLGFEMLRNISLKDFFIGYGYFGLAENVPQLLYNSDLNPYFQMRASLNDSQTIGILNLVLYFGLFQCGLIAVVLSQVKKYANDAWLYMLSIFVVFLPLTYNSDTVNYLVHMFFVFGLSWVSTHSRSGKRFDRKAEIIFNRILNR